MCDPAGKVAVWFRDVLDALKGEICPNYREAAMKKRAGSNAIRAVLTAALALILVGLAQVALGGSVDPIDKWAWSTNAGWINFSPVCDGCEGVTVHGDHLEGYAWAENIGWIRLGTHTGGGSHNYHNTSATNYGVNIDPSGELYGYAWGTDVGWILFDPTEGGVTIDPSTGSLDGYAWGENVGWIHFKNDNPAYNVVATLNRVYLPLVQRVEAPPPTPDPGNLVTNGGFETGDFTGWTPEGALPRTVQDSVRHEGTYAAALGEVKQAPYLTQPGSARIIQEVVVPSGAAYTLSFWYRLKTYDRDEEAFFQMQLRDGDGSFLEQIEKHGYTGIIPPTGGIDYGWKSVSRDLSAYQGQTIQLWFEMVQAKIGQGAWTFVDDVRVE
jgi:hypothetical protein